MNLQQIVNFKIDNFHEKNTCILDESYQTNTTIFILLEDIYETNENNWGDPSERLQPNLTPLF